MMLCCCVFGLIVCFEDKVVKIEQVVKVSIDKNFFLSCYILLVGEFILIINVMIFDGIGNKIDKGMVYFVDGKIVEIGEMLLVLDGVCIIDGQGKWVMLGIIDVYSYFGVYLNFFMYFYFDGNEIVKFVIVNVWVEYLVWLQDFGFGWVFVGGVMLL